MFIIIWIWYLCQTQGRLEQAGTFQQAQPRVETSPAPRQSPGIFKKTFIYFLIESFYRARQSPRVATVDPQKISESPVL